MAEIPIGDSQTPTLRDGLHQACYALQELITEYKQLLAANQAPDTMAVITAEETLSQLRPLLPPQPLRQVSPASLRLQQFINHLLTQE